MKQCRACGEREAETSWTLTACANKRRRVKVPLCLPCDVELNALVLRFVKLPDAEELIAAYRTEKLG